MEGKYDFYGNGEITDVYIGGVFGYAEDAITLNGTSTKPNTEKQKTYNNIVSGVEIHQVDTETLKIMNNYVGGGNASYNFSVKYFLIGIACMAIIPVIYTLFSYGKKLFNRL